ncbi:MAG: STM4015 family protein [Rubrivivax sp.]|nr:STM4015 family protein [Pyrinomonadaceae bacterium]
MSVHEHATEFAGKPVIEWEPGMKLVDPANNAYRIGLSYDESEDGASWEEKFNAFLTEPGSGEVTALVVGVWGDLTGPLENSRETVEAVASAAGRLPSLRALFLGDIIGEEHEISWIEQTDVSSLFVAYPQLEHFRVRGGNGLRLGTFRHERLKSLVVESGGLDASVVRDVTSSQLPSLEHLELWLGDDNYGASAEMVDLAPLFTGKLFPKLSSLGLRDSELSDAIAVAVAHSPVLEQLRVLDLSLGTLSDDGAAVFLSSPAAARLELLDLHHHFCSDEMIEKLEAAGIKVDASEPQLPDEDGNELYRYVAVSE